MIKSIVFFATLVIGFSIFIFSMNKIISYLRIGKKENRLNNFKQRLSNTFVIALFQKKLLRQRLAGILHAAIFWGFLVLIIFVIEGFIEGFFHKFSFHFLDKFYSLLTLSQDIFGLLVIIAVIFSLIRRYVLTPKRLQVDISSKLDATFILLLILMVMLTMFGANIERILLGNSHGFRPISNLIAQFFNTNGSETTYEIFWWAHNIIILFFLNFLPYSKHFHVITSVPNTFLSNYKIDSKNTLKAINFEDETIEQYGAKDIQDFYWKQLLDGYTCTECGRCTEACPANSTGKLLNPKKIITQIRKRTSEKGPLLRHKIENDPVLNKSIVGDYITQEELWACTTCASCVEECPVMIDHLTSIVDMRRHLTMMESSFPPELNTVFRNLENNESPWAFGPESRNEWIEEFNEEITNTNIKSTLNKLCDLGSADGTDILFWVGCAGAFDQRYRNVTKSIAKLLSVAGIKFGVLGNEEKCNGDTARRLGNEFLAQQFIQQNIETFKKYDIKKVITACPHCFHSLKNEYKSFGYELEVHHHSEYIISLLKADKIKSIKNCNKNITYHDSCYLGRYNNIYESPRDVFNYIPDIKLIEMKRERDKGFCCGAGGGRMFMEENEGKRVNIERTEEAINTQADTIATACPFCMTMLNDGIKEKGKSDFINVKDIAEILSENL